MIEIDQWSRFAFCSFISSVLGLCKSSHAIQVAAGGGSQGQIHMRAT